MFTEKLAILPEQPGVYLMYDKAGKIIYVGKAVNLKNRIKTYFTGTPTDNKTMHLVTNITDFDYIITNTESEAFILEANLIKKHQPHYNILLKDDKRYPFIKITADEDFPRIEITRDIAKDGNNYYGPFTDVRYLRQLVRDLEWIFPLRTCTKTIKQDKISNERACLNAQMGKCPAPCIGKVSKADYQALITKVVKYIMGKNDELLKDMRKEMEECAENLEFEKAARLRDKIRFIENNQKKQVVFFADFENRDIIAHYREDKLIAVALLKMVNGKINGKEIFNFKVTDNDSTESVLRTFLLQYYIGRADESENPESNPKDRDAPLSTPPPNFQFNQIILQTEPEDYDQLNILFKKKIHIPARGEYKQLIEIARKNAFDHVESMKLAYMRKASRTIVSVQELKQHLNLKNLPRKMVCIDISTIQGSETVSSLVFFENGKPLKKHYRHFIINTVHGQDDYASIAETLSRYLKNLKKEDGWEMPDLIIVDGGKGQLNSAYGILRQAQAEHEKLQPIEIVSLAKRIEEVFIPKFTPHDASNGEYLRGMGLQYDCVIIPKTSPALKIITHIRDEAHRFAITHHRKRRDNRTLSCELDNIKALSENNKFALLKHFGSVENIKKATKDELLIVKGIGDKIADAILDS